MITSKEIKGILNQVPVGTAMSVTDIQALVRNSWCLTKKDWEIHTTTRPTNYRRWLHRIQGVLSEYKRKGIVKHNPATHVYTF